MKISLLLVSKNEEKNVPTFIRSLRKQTKLPDEIVLVDASTDRTLEMMKKNLSKKPFQKIKKKFFKANPYSCSYQRWLGLKHVTGDLTLLTDIDAELDKKWLEEITEPFKNRDVSVVQGNVTSSSFADEDWMFSKGLPEKGKYLNHCNAAYRTRLLKKFNFDPQIRYGDDRDMSYRLTRAGIIIYGRKTAKVWHHQSGHANKKSERGWTFKNFKSSSRQSYGFAFLIKKYKSPYWFARMIYNILHIFYKRGFSNFTFYVITTPIMLFQVLFVETIKERFFGWTPNPYLKSNRHK